MRLSNHSSQTGSMIVLALFVIIILGLLGLSLANQLRSSSQNVVYEVLGSRALLAAQSGLEQIAASAFPLNGAPVICNQTQTSPAGFASLSGLQNCDFSASCSTRIITNEAGEQNYYYQFQSTGTCEGGAVWSSRTVSQDGFIRANP